MRKNQKDSRGRKHEEAHGKRQRDCTERTGTDRGRYAELACSGEIPDGRYSGIRGEGELQQHTITSAKSMHKPAKFVM